MITRALWLVGIVGVSAVAQVSAADSVLIEWRKHKLTDQFWCEGAAVGDFNRDGMKDVVSGPFWYAGPDFSKRQEIYPATQTFKKKKPDGTEETIPGYEGLLGVNNAYSENFLAFTDDFNRDGWVDVLVLGFPGKESFWYENSKGAAGHWKRHVAVEVTDNESPTYVDIDGDGRRDIVCNSGGYFGFATIDPQNPTAPWRFHRVTPKGPWQRFTHGMGVGDVNGDGRLDILEKDGWWEQPKSIEGDPEWVQHKFLFSPGGGSQMYAYDVDGDGDNDVITGIAAHGYGLAWYENRAENGQITFKDHTFMNKEPSENRYGVKFSQLHAVDLRDMDGDGLKDIVTGKRIWAHGPTGDAEPNAPAVLYWFRLVRGPGKAVDFVPYRIDDDSGVGTQVLAEDVNGDGHPDIVVGNKKGTFVHIQTRRNVSRAEWEKAQPKPAGGS